MREMVEDAMDADDVKGETTLVGAAAAGAATSNKRKIEVKKWNAVAVWSWSTSFDSCAICRNTLHEPSIEFQANSQQEGADGLSIAVRLRITCMVSFALLSFASRGARFRTRAFDSSQKRFKNEISALKLTTFYLLRFANASSSCLNKHTVGELRSRFPLRLHLQVVETTVVLPVVSKRVGVYEDGEDTVTGVGRERLRKKRERETERRRRDGVRWNYCRLRRRRRCI